MALKIINYLKSKGNVFISSERKLSNDLNKYKIKISPKDIHHFLYYSTLYIGDSQTMAAECAILGTPFIRFNDFVGKLSYLDELENHYQLGYWYSLNNKSDLIPLIQKLLSNGI